jgi:hypothetical protein
MLMVIANERGQVLRAPALGVIAIPNNSCRKAKVCNACALVRQSRLAPLPELPSNTSEPIWIGRHGIHDLAHPGNDRLRRPSRREDPKPDAEIHGRVNLLEQRDVRKIWSPLTPEHREEFCFPRHHMGERHRVGLDMEDTGQEVGHRLPGAAIGEMQDINACLSLESLAYQVTVRTDPWCAPAQLTRILLGIRREVLN